jgi:RNA polymerase sigma factor (TIGR02999 family)
MAAAREIERVLVDHARQRFALKRGGDPAQGGHVRVPLDVVDLACDEDGGTAVALNAAILRLEQEDGQAAAVVRLRFFVGLTAPEAALALGISERTVVREWTFARAFLATELEGAE